MPRWCRRTRTGCCTRGGYRRLGPCFARSPGSAMDEQHRTYCSSLGAAHCTADPLRVASSVPPEAESSGTQSARSVPGAHPSCSPFSANSLSSHTPSFAPPHTAGVFCADVLRHGASSRSATDAAVPARSGICRGPTRHDRNRTLPPPCPAPPAPPAPLPRYGTLASSRECTNVPGRNS